MSKELTWVEAAVAVLENSTNVWMTAPDLVREIHRTGIRELKSTHPQAVRSLRSALNFQSHKENGLFSRKEEECSVYFALKRRLKGSGNGSKAPNKIHFGKMTPQVKDKEKSNKSTKPQSTPPNQNIVNGLPPHPPPLPLHPLVPPQPYTIEIDPSLKYTQSSGLSSESVGNFCLPSPRQSILGPIRTLHIFNESNSTNHRPVRQARMRKSLKDQENSSPDAMMTNSTYEAMPSQPALAPPPVCEVLRLETCHPVPSLLSEVVCVRYPSTSNSTSRKSSVLDEDPCKVQGERKCSGRFEIQLLEHFIPMSSESEFDDDDDDDDDDITSMDTQSESEAESGDRVLLQPTPRQQLIMPKPLRRFSSSSYSETLRVDESLLARESSQFQSESIPCPTKPTRGYSVDLGRITGANSFSSGRAGPRSTEPRSLEGAVKKATNSDYVPYTTLDQRRYVSSLFQPTSPLVGENMKLLLNMNAYRGLTEYQKRKLRSLLPSIDRGGIESSPGGSISESSFSNAFFSSALREWQEHVALGSFTPEYKAKMRGEEKRRLAARAEELWKQKFYEENWGDKKEGAEDQRDSFPVPYYPHGQQLAAATPSSQHATDCLRAILDAYHGKDTKQEEEPTPSSSNSTSVPSNPPPSASCDSSLLHSNTPTPAPVIKPPPSATTAKSGATTGRKEKSAAQISRGLASSRKMNRTTKSSSTSPTKNHLVKKPAAHSQSLGSKNLLPSLLKSTAKVTTTAPAANKKVAVNKKTAVKRLGVSTKSQQAYGGGSKSLGKAILYSMRNQSTGQYLTRLPPKLPYQTLLSALEQASKDNTAIKNKNDTSATIITSYTPPSHQHNHSVFHDHFSLLSNEHVPTEFSLPITSLPIKLPRDMYHTCLRAKVVRQEHSYSKPSTTGSNSGSESVTVTPPSHLHQLVQKKQPQEQRHRELSVAGLKLSLPRSLIRTKENCECDGRALVFCSRCHSLYHTECVGSSGGTLCPRCVTIASLLS